MRRFNRILTIGLSVTLGGVLATSLASAKDGEAIDAHLPTAMPFPLRDLWAVRRPGPQLQLHALPPR